VTRPIVGCRSIDQAAILKRISGVATSAPSANWHKTVARAIPGDGGLARAARCALGLLARGRAVGQHVAAGVVLLIPLSAALGYLYGADSTRPRGTTEVSAYTWQC
jgi:hypothetical protein